MNRWTNIARVDGFDGMEASKVWEIVPAAARHVKMP